MRPERRLQAFNERRRAFLDEMETLELGKLLARPLPGKWSIIEIIEHLVLAERVVFQGLPEPSLLKTRERGPRDRFRYLVVLFVLRTGIPVKVGTPAMLPRGGLEVAGLRRLWDENQEWLRRYLESLDAKGIQSATLHHPQSGPISVSQAIELSHAHLGAHLRQIRTLQRLLA